MVTLRFVPRLDFVVVLLVLACTRAAGQSASTTQRIEGFAYVSPEGVGAAQDLAANGTAGRVYTFDLILNDAVSNGTIGALQGFLVVIRTRELSQIVYTLTMAEGTLQMSGLLSTTNPALEAGVIPRVFPITGGTGKYTGVSGSYQMTSSNLAPSSAAPTPTAGPGILAKGPATNGVILEITYPVAVGR